MNETKTKIPDGYLAEADLEALRAAARPARYDIYSTITTRKNPGSPRN